RCSTLATLALLVEVHSAFATAEPLRSAAAAMPRSKRRTAAITVLFRLRRRLIAIGAERRLPDIHPVLGIAHAPLIEIIAAAWLACWNTFSLRAITSGAGRARNSSRGTMASFRPHLSASR